MRVLTVAHNRSAELTLTLSSRALGALRKQGQLPIKVTIVTTRGDQITTTSTLVVVLHG